jgi:general secretion pathway protein D
MKTISAFLSVVLGTLAGFLTTQFALAGAEAPLEKPEHHRTFSSLDKPSAAKEETIPAGLIKFQDTELNEVFKIYQTISGRTLIRSAALPATTVTLENLHPLTRREALQLLDTALAQTGITMIPQGLACVKAVPQAQAPTESAPIPDLTRDQLPDSLSYITYVVELKGMKANSVLPCLTPFCKTPNSLITLPEADLLVMRDYSANIRRMLQILDRIENARKDRLAQ